ncbi:hypothetical protein EPYR_03825 [Erwinia pyrifoliae DSM 12163]|nr:hypothetical protein EJP617_10440 [Erwinia sp. Ejp617]CAY76205.1 hypothetical protein EPYR_03825 [Erwinia pyrifoliae DSM 12163]
MNAFRLRINPFSIIAVKSPHSHSHYHLALLFFAPSGALQDVQGFQIYKAE